MKNLLTSRSAVTFGWLVLAVTAVVLVVAAVMWNFFKMSVPTCENAFTDYQRLVVQTQGGATPSNRVREVAIARASLSIACKIPPGKTKGLNPSNEVLNLAQSPEIVAQAEKAFNDNRNWLGLEKNKQ